MDVKCVILLCFLEFILLLLIEEVRQQEFNKGEMNHDNSNRGCEYLHCEKNDVCTHRKFRCKERPCPSMLYCAKSQTELTKGPSTCDTVQCTMGYICMLKVRRCQWDTKCERQIARCVSRKEYFEGPASCAGFKCPQGNHCILRESLCAKPPCKLLRSCVKNKEVHFWFGRCRSLGCPSEYECFLRRPENNCIEPPCKHTPDCIATRENEVVNKYCLGWICPRMQTCAAETVGLCETDDCDVKRTCQDIRSVAKNDSSLSFSRRSLRKEDEVPRNDTKASTLEEIEVHGPKTPLSWLDHLNSKTELDAIELWIKNAEGQNDFKQFQDWLRSIRDILGPSAYSVWLKENLSSRGEKLREWLQASHDIFDVEGPIFPRQEISSIVTENSYPAWNTMIIPQDWNNLGEDSILLPEEQKFTDKTRYPNDVPIDLLEKVVQSLYSAANESMTEDYDGQHMNDHRQDYQPMNFRNEPRNQNFQWILVKHSEDNEDISRDRSSNDNTNQFSSNTQDKRNLTNDNDQIIKLLIDKLSSIQNLNDSDYSIDVHQELQLPRPTDDDKDAMDLDLFFEQNKHIILPHVQTLMETINEENDPPSHNSEPDPDKSSKRNFFINNANFGSVDEFPNEVPFLRTEPPNSYIEEIPNNAKSVEESEFLKEKFIAKCFAQNQMKQDSSNSQLQQERDSRTPGPLFADGEPTVQTFYNLPSYGASDDDDITVHDFIYEPNNQQKNKDDSMAPSIDYADYG